MNRIINFTNKESDLDFTRVEKNIQKNFYIG